MSRVLLRYVAPPSSLISPLSSPKHVKSTLLTSIQNLVGSVTGSKEWQESGSHDTEAGVNAMKAASANRDANAGYGKIEEVAGKVTGCEGMEKEGAQSKKE